MPSADPPAPESLPGGEPEVVASDQIAEGWWRIYATRGRHPSDWDTFRRWGPSAMAGRFDPHEPPPHEQDEGVAYVGMTIPTTLAEVFWRTRAMDVETGGPWIALVEPRRPFQLLDLRGDVTRFAPLVHGSGVGESDAYWFTQRLARALRNRFPFVDGVLYDSHRSPETDGACVALWLPAASGLPQAPSTVLPLNHPAPAWQDRLTAAAAQIGYAAPGH